MRVHATARSHDACSWSRSVADFNVFAFWNKNKRQVPRLCAFLCMGSLHSRRHLVLRANGDVTAQTQDTTWMFRVKCSQWIYECQRNVRQRFHNVPMRRVLGGSSLSSCCICCHASNFTTGILKLVKQWLSTPAHVSVSKKFKLTCWEKLLIAERLVCTKKF